MKKLHYILPLIAGMLLFSACEDDSDRNPTRVVDEYIDKYETLLTSSELGWRFDYYPQENVYGAFNFLIDFKEGNRVDMLTDRSFFDLFIEEEDRINYETQESSYRIHNSQGIVLTFDTYSLLSKLADPSFTNFNFGSGWSGDNEFILMGHSTDKDTIYLKSVRAQKHCYLVKNTVDWDTYFNNLNKVIEDFKTDATNTYFYDLVLPGQENAPAVLAGFDLKTRVVTVYHNEEGITMADSCQLMFTENGVQLRKPITIHGQEISKFAYDTANGTFSVNGIAGSTVQVAANGRPKYVFEDVQDTLFLGVTTEDGNKLLDYYTIMDIPEIDYPIWTEVHNTLVNYAGLAMSPNDWQNRLYSLTLYDMYKDDNEQSVAVRAQCPVIWSWVNGTQDQVRFRMSSRPNITYASLNRIEGAYETGTVLANKFKAALGETFLNLANTLFKNKTFVVVPSLNLQSFMLVNVENGECIPISRED